MPENTPCLSLTIPTDGFADVARRVLGGAAGMLDFGYEAVDDVQLALELVLRAGLVASDPATIAIAGDPTGLTVRVGDVDATAIQRRIQIEPGSRMSLGDLLERVVDGLNVTDGPLPELVLYKACAPRMA